MSATLTTPVEIDTVLAEALFQQAKADDKLRRMVKMRRESAYYRHVYSLQDVAEAQADVEVLVIQIDGLNNLYTGWPRYWHVTNANGHIHTSQSCSSCFPDTQFGWRTDLSGLTPEEVVEREAYNACSVCMPIAPAEQKQARAYYNKQQKEARAAERQAKKDTKDAKARERAEKHVAKVEKVINGLGGWDVFWNDYSLYGHDGRKSVYHLDVPAQIHDTLYALKQDDLKGGIHRLNQHIENILIEKGII